MNGSSDVVALERQIIGLALNGTTDLGDVRRVKPEWFADVRHAHIWQKVQELDAQGSPVDVQILWDAVSKLEPGKRTGIDRMYLYDAWSQAPAGHVGEQYAQSLAEQYQRREVGNVLTRTAQLLESGMDVREIRLGAIDDLTGLDASEQSGQPLPEILDGLLEDYRTPSRFTVTPWKSLNRVIRGWRPGGLYIVGARPGVGKSLFLLDAAFGLARHGTVLLETLEMSAKEVGNRLLASKSGVEMRFLNGLLPDGSGGPNDQEMVALRETRDRLATVPLMIRDKGMTTALDIREHAREAAAHGTLSGIVVDYLQLMSSGGRVESRQQEISTFTRQLKLMAKEFDCPVIVASQLNRDGVKDGQRPTLNALRESGSIEQDADVVILLSESEFAEPGATQVPISVSVAKNRQGPNREFELLRDGSRAQIVDEN